MKTIVREYLTALCEVQTTPIEVFIKIQENPEYYSILDVRIGEDLFLKEKIIGSKRIPLNELPDELQAIKKNKKIAVYTWSSDCTLAKHALLMLDEAGIEAIEIAGGIASWTNANLPVDKLV